VILFLNPIAFRPTVYGYTSDRHWEAVGNSIYRIDSNRTSNASSQAAPDGSGYSRYHKSGLFGFRPVAAAYFAAMYFASMFLATFLNVAFYREILNALSGRPVSILDGIRFACTKWKIILMWTLFAGIVGFIIKSLEQRFGWIGEIIMRLIGTVWSIACVFVIPVIITEEQTSNPFVVLKKSAQTLTKTWGESLIGYVGVSFGSTILLLLSLCWLGTGIAVAVMLHSIWLGAAAVLSWLMLLIAFSYLMSVASQIFRCALFLYASQGTLPHPYNEEMMTLAWKMKKS
ncbi:MAG: conserved hypothetical rane protein, partial [Pedosphaera sp.]|nr:conserved hypothetical rane protein [Pedosphaera sp.]